MPSSLPLTTPNPGFRFIAALGLLISISALSIDIVLPAIPSLADTFAVSESTSQLVVTSYVLGFALGQIPMGLLADRYGRRDVVLFGLLVFILSGALTALSGSLALLCAARFVQGVSGAVGSVIARAIVRDIGGPDGGARLMATMVGILGLAPLCAPLIGGVLTDLFGWQSPFAASAIYGILALLAFGLFVPETRRPGKPERALAQVRRSINAICTSPPTLVSIAIICLPFAGYMAIITSSSSVLIDQYDLTPTHFGLVFAIAAAAYTGGAYLARHLANTKPAEDVLRLAMVLSGVVLAPLLYCLISSPPLWALWSSVMAFIFALSMAAPMATTIALRPLADSAGFGVAILGAAQLGTGALGSLLSAAFYRGTEDAMCLVMASANVLVVLVYVCFRRALHVAPSAPGD